MEQTIRDRTICRLSHTIRPTARQTLKATYRSLRTKYRIEYDRCRLKYRDDPILQDENCLTLLFDRDLYLP